MREYRMAPPAASGGLRPVMGAFRRSVAPRRSRRKKAADDQASATRKGSMVEVGDRQHATKLAWRSPLLNKKPSRGWGG
jgi:hypothetical protein